jgi:hypothetical protein
MQAAEEAGDFIYVPPTQAEGEDDDGDEEFADAKSSDVSNILTF